MDMGEFWLWTILFVFTGYLFVKIFCLFFLNSRQRHQYLPLQQSDRDYDNETINIDYADYVSIVSTKYESIN
tara:strand:+ start:2327 stop:2542 length:216 start_codon:yes stop_codon:yes gene_type:complete